MGSRTQRTTLYSTPGGGTGIPLLSGAAQSVGIRPPAINNAVELQVLGISSDSLQVTVTQIPPQGVVDIAYSYLPATLPVNFTLVRGATGILWADLGFPVLPEDSNGLPYGVVGISRSLRFGLGTPSNPGSTYWQLNGNQTYQAATVVGSIRFFNPDPMKTTVKTTLTLVGWAWLIATPPTVL